MPYSYLGTQGILNGLNVGDPFFNKLGATVTERTYCDSGSCTAYMMTIGATAGVDPESLVHSRYIIIWACNTISTNLHLWPIIAEAQKRGAKVVVHRPGAAPHRAARRLAHPDPPRHRRRAGAGDDARDHQRGPAPTRPTSATTPSASTSWPSASQLHPRVGVAGDRHSGRGHPHARPRVRHHRPVGDPHRRRGGAARRRRPDRARHRLPARAGRRLAARRRRPAAAAALGVPGELARADAPRARSPGTRVVNQFLLGRALTGELGSTRRSRR